MTNHVSFNFNTVPVLSSIDINYGSYHFRDDNAVSKMSSDWLGLFTIGCFLLGLSELLDESIISLMDSMSESSSLSGFHELNEGVHVVFNESLQFNTSVCGLLEGLL